MLIRTSIDRPLFYEFIFNLSFDPRLVCPSGFMLSPLGSEVMISCHVAFFRVICYNPALQIKITTTAPPGHVHEDFSTVIDEVKPAPVEKRKLVLLHYIGRSLHACLLVLLSSHCLGLSRSKHDSGGHSLSLSLCSPLVTNPAGSSPPGKVRRCNVHAVVLGDGSYPQLGASRSACLAVLSQAPLAREGLRPLLPRCRSVGRSGLPPPT